MSQPLKTPETADRKLQAENQLTPKIFGPALRWLQQPKNINFLEIPFKCSRGT